MEALFLKLLDMSLSAGWLVLAVIAARLVLKRAPKWVICALWALVAFRLMCPVSIESTWSLLPETETVAEAVQTEPAYQKGDVLFVATTPSEPQDDGTYAAGEAHAVIAAEDIYDEETAVNWMWFFSILWLAGMTSMVLYTLWSFWRIRRKVAASIPLEPGVLVCDYIDTPFILGILRPRIYLPSSLSQVDTAYVLAHERAHLKRKDHCWKPLGYLLLSIYWFHPLLWAAYILLCRDIELACDERVIRDMGVGDKKAYSEALLHLRHPLPPGMGGGGLAVPVLLARRL